jgi:hypothetical protein
VPNGALGENGKIQKRDVEILLNFIRKLFAREKIVQPLTDKEGKPIMNEEGKPIAWVWNGNLENLRKYIENLERPLK